MPVWHALILNGRDFYASLRLTATKFQSTSFIELSFGRNKRYCLNQTDTGIAYGRQPNEHRCRWI
jgi:hypothetical protein